MPSQPSPSRPKQRYAQDARRKRIPPPNAALMRAWLTVSRLQKYVRDLLAVLLLALGLLTLLG
ncbi:MAG: hypothetical protein ACREBU_09160, partial [Nitrososphaera sp.]